MNGSEFAAANASAAARGGGAGKTAFSPAGAEAGVKRFT